MENKKYSKYKIIVTYMQGNKEEVSRENINSSSYKEMIDLYRKTREELRNSCTNIKFIGINNDSKMKIFFEKQFITDEDTEKFDDCKTFELIQKLIDDIEILSRKKYQVSEGIGVYDKKQDVLLHEIESSKEPTNYEKIKIFDNLKKIREQRRSIKNEKEVIDGYFNKLSGNGLILKHFKNISETYIQHKRNCLIKMNSKIVPLTKEKAEELKIIKEVGYKNFKERLILTKELQKNYDKVYHDEGKMRLICYNKSRSC